MTKQERWNIYDSGAIHQLVAIELLDWAGYWTTAGVSGIADPLTRVQTQRAVRMILEDLAYCNKIVVGMVISDPGFKNTETVTEELISGIVTSIMSFRLGWITDIWEVEAE